MTVDELKILITAETKDLRKKLDGVEKKLKSTNTQGARTGRDMSAAFKKIGLAVVATSAVLAKLTSVVARVGMEFEDLKDSLDTVFGSMQDGDKAMSSVFKFAQTTPFQVETVTKAFIALKSVGIEPTNKMLQTFADTASVSIDQLGVFEALVRVVQRSAGGGLGLEELNMLNDRGIPALKILQEELGLAKDDIATFGKTAEGAKIITDALQEGLDKRFGGAMENKMDNLSTKVSNMTIAFRQFANEIFESGVGDFLKGLADTVTSVVDSATRFMQKMGGRGTGLKMETPTITKEMTAEEIKQERLRASRLNLEKLINAELEASDHFLNRKGFADEKGMANALKRLGIAQKERAEEEALIDRIEKGNGILDEREKNRLKTLGEQHQALSTIIAAVEKQKGKVDEVTLANKHLQEIFVKNEELFASMGVNIDQIEEALKNFNKTVEETTTFSEHMTQAIGSSAATFSKEFTDALLEGENALNSFKDFAKNIVSQIISTFLQLQIVNKILNSIFGDGPTSGPFDTMSDGKIIKGESAGGGTIQRGAPTLVGERGPEIFVPNTGGTIMNNMNSKNAMGGSPIIVNQSVNFATGVVPTVRAEVTKMLPQISDVTKGAVLEAAMRGGGYRKGLLGA
jgi:predicted DNA-binding ArsR family transcriptional regulator